MTNALKQIIRRQADRRKNWIERRAAKSQTANVNFLLITMDSCRYDVFCDAQTPILDSFGPWHPAQSPASYTYAAHHSFFAGILPNASEPVPYYNRFTRQLLGLVEVGEEPVKKSTYFTVVSNRDAIDGIRHAGFQTVGTGAMNWFRQSSLTTSFEHFQMLTSADTQVDYLLRELDISCPFFAFANFGETHDPFDYRGKQTPCPVRIQARLMSWPPVESGPVGRDHEAYWHQVEALEFLDAQLGRLFAKLPANTIAVVCGDHGECFGEGGYWGHGINHPKVYEVPLGIFRLDRQPIEGHDDAEADMPVAQPKPQKNALSQPEQEHSASTTPIAVPQPHIRKLVRRVLAVEGMLTSHEAAELIRLSAMVDGDSCVLEVGSYRGRSTTALALGSQIGDKNVPVYAIDPHEPFSGVLGGTFGPADRRAFFRNLVKADVVEQVRLVNLSSEIVSKGWTRPIGLLWLDGDHSLEGVRRDFDAWAPHLTSDAVVAFHDACDPDIGPKQMIDLLLNSGNFEHMSAVDDLVALRRRL